MIHKCWCAGVAPFLPNDDTARLPIPTVPQQTERSIFLAGAEKPRRAVHVLSVEDDSTLGFGTREGKDGSGETTGPKEESLHLASQPDPQNELPDPQNGRGLCSPE